jgi:hypothetical protein
MCWSANVSLNTYILGLFACIFAYVNNKISLSTLFFNQSFMVMQLLEYFIWSKQFSNKLLSQIGYILVLMQPIVGILTIENNDKIKYLSLLFYICFLGIVFITKPWSTVNFKTAPAANGHLAWNWLNLSAPFLLIWLFFLSLRIIANKQWFFLGLVYFLAITSYIFYHKTLTWGSLWCWISNFIALFYIYIVFENDVCLHIRDKYKQFI